MAATDVDGSDHQYKSAHVRVKAILQGITTVSRLVYRLCQCVVDDRASAVGKAGEGDGRE